MQGTLATKDTYIDGHNVNGNNGGEGVMYCGRNATVGTPLIGVVELPMPAISAPFSASFFLTKWRGSNPLLSIALIEPEDWDWKEEQATWNGFRYTVVEQIEPVSFSGTPDIPTQLSVSALVERATQSSYPFLVFGILPASTDFESTVFHSRNANVSNELKPRLVIING